MNILILGGCGFLASNCIKYLQKNNNIHVIDRWINPINHEIKYSQINMTDTEKIITYIKSNNINIVMHFVSGLLPQSNITDFENELTDVYFPTLKILEFCAADSIKFVYISSGGAIYGNNNTQLLESTPKSPISLYGLAKHNLENAILFYNRTKKLNYLIIRPSNPYGPGQNLFGKQGLIAVMIGKTLKKQPIEIFGNGSAKKDYIYIDDFAYYVSTLIQVEDSNWNSIYNIGSGKGHSINEIINIFKQLNIELPEIKYTNTLETDVQNFVLDCTKVKSIVDYKMTEIEDGIKKFYSYVIENKENILCQK